MLPLVAALVLLAPPTDGFRDLFNGRDLDGWVVEGPDKDKAGTPLWAVADGTITCTGKGFGFLRYDREQFTDFTLRVEYRFAPNTKGNSGLGIRMGKYDPKKSTETRASYASFEVQLLDDAGKPANDHGTASLYRYKGPTVNRVKPAPEWNVIEVTCVGPKYAIAVNGETVLEADQTELKDLPAKEKPANVPAVKDKPLSGYVAVQSHSGPVTFRKVQIKTLPAGK